MHRELRRKRNVTGERKAQTVARPVADPAFAQETIGAVEQFGRAQTGPFPRVRALIGAFVCRRELVG